MSEWKDRVLAYNEAIRQALLTLFNELNEGQQKKLRKNKTVSELFDRYQIQ